MGRRSGMAGAKLGALLAVMVLSCAAVPSWAEAPADDCAVPDDLGLVHYPLDRVYVRLKAKEPLRILVVGSTSSTGSPAWAKRLGTPFRAYPRLLEGALAARLPGLSVSVVDKAQAGQTAPMVAGQLDAALLEGRPDLVIWETGTTDAVKGEDVNVFGDALDDGLNRLRERGIDVLMVDIQYSPQTEAIYDFSPYLNYLWRLGEADGINVFRRFDIMRFYVDEGRFQPSATNPADQVRNANFVHNCLARQLARMILTAAQQPQD